VQAKAAQDSDLALYDVAPVSNFKKNQLRANLYNYSQTPQSASIEIDKGTG